MRDRAAPVVITGGASGIGLATAEIILYESDNDVTVADVQEMPEIGAGYIETDVRNPSDIDDAYKAAGDVDLVVIGDAGWLALAPALRKASDAVGREIIRCR